MVCHDTGEAEGPGADVSLVTGFSLGICSSGLTGVGH